MKQNNKNTPVPHPKTSDIVRQMIFTPETYGINETVVSYCKDPTAMADAKIVAAVYEIARLGYPFIYLEFLEATKAIWKHETKSLQTLFNELHSI